MDRCLRKPLLVALLLFLAEAVLFLTLRTNDYLAVDGALRALDIFYHPRLSVHPNNHPLYPINVPCWIRFLRLLGLWTTSPLHFIKLVQAMNAIGSCGMHSHAVLALLPNHLGKFNVVDRFGWVWSKQVLRFARDKLSRTDDGIILAKS